MDNQAVVTRIIGDTCQMRQTKVLLAREFPAHICEQSRVAVHCIDAIGANQNEQIYMAISSGSGGFTVWHMTMDQKSQMQILQKSVQTGPTEVLHVDSAHNGEQINLMHFVRIGDESYLATSASLDQRVNFWRI